MSLGVMGGGVVSTAGVAVLATLFSADFLVLFAIILKFRGLMM